MRPALPQICAALDSTSAADSQRLRDDLQSKQRAALALQDRLTQLEGSLEEERRQVAAARTSVSEKGAEAAALQAKVGGLQCGVGLCLPACRVLAALSASCVRARGTCVAVACCFVDQIDVLSNELDAVRDTVQQRGQDLQSAKASESQLQVWRWLGVPWRRACVQWHCLPSPRVGFGADARTLIEVPGVLCVFCVCVCVCVCGGGVLRPACVPQSSLADAQRQLQQTHGVVEQLQREVASLTAQLASVESARAAQCKVCGVALRPDPSAFPVAVPLLNPPRLSGSGHPPSLPPPSPPRPLVPCTAVSEPGVPVGD